MKVKNLVFVGIFAAITAVFSLVSIPIGAVPVSLNFIGVYLSAIILGGKWGTLSQIIYILIGAVGLPVFAGFKSGFNTLAGPTGGYLLGYIAIAFIVGTFSEKKKDSNFIQTSLVSLLGLFVCYLLGTLQLAFVNHYTFVQAFMAGVVPFILFDCAKVAVAVLAADRIKASLKKANLKL